MKTEGTLKLGNKEEKVTGVIWMDHEYGLIYHKDFLAWHWLSATLENDVDLVFGLVNYFSGAIVPESFCTIRYPDGHIEHLERKDFNMRPIRTWKSSMTNFTFGIDWKMEIPKLNIKLQGKAIRDKQEMIVPPIIFWEGLCKIEGSFNGKTVQGRGFLETYGDYKVPFRKIYRS